MLNSDEMRRVELLMYNVGECRKAIITLCISNTNFHILSNAKISFSD